MVAIRMDSRSLARAGLTETMFLGVVRAIAKEVGESQDIHTDELVGMAYEYCAEALARFDPERMNGLGNKAFARFAFIQVKPSMIRDITRERRYRSGRTGEGDLPKMRVWDDPSIVECDKTDQIDAEAKVLALAQRLDPISRAAITRIVMGEPPAMVARRMGFESVDELVEFLKPVRKLVEQALEERSGGHTQDTGGTGSGKVSAGDQSEEGESGDGGSWLFGRA